MLWGNVTSNQVLDATQVNRRSWKASRMLIKGKKKFNLSKSCDIYFLCTSKKSLSVKQWED